MKNGELLEQSNKQLAHFEKLVNKDHVLTDEQKKSLKTQKLKVGVDLGTSSIVLTVLDKNSHIIYGDFEYDHAVQDGIVVNYMDSVNILRRLKKKAEENIGVELTTAAGAIPPKTGEKSSKVVANVIEEAGFTCTNVVDEPTAAATFLKIKNGTVVDIGGGTTGITIFKNKKIQTVIDEPTGGFHMTLVLGGRYKIKNEEAEKLKRNKDREEEVYTVIRPVVEKMATIVEKLGSQVEDPVIVVGGATNFTEFTTTFSKVLGRKVYKPLYPQFVTPLGIALCDHAK
ncbi:MULTISPECIES: ethanolamine utilization protein EutJ [Limosilactobacillus]|jgi:ethanolamine utilization protein EutJ|uniref:Ethanolamine utilization protein EutJ family protein n=1 Tax=Limosilactobacillus panis DSM 6035 TaxID=1423782 RepID=A0A0R1XFF0_9LACO|nr:MULTISPECIES: ethanolamine utilization protein EutJ [Limosilactobacillus]KRM28750.1 ethanolamine utilization protein EutJ family protein [Limosilactobacillus panis DSM 6035]QZN93107.1 ethanolamine utilization protein EutJ [Limosilactobacillus panis]